MNKVVFVNGKAHLKIGPKKIPVANDISIPHEMEGQPVTDEKIVYVDNKPMAVEFYVNNVRYLAADKNIKLKQNEPAATIKYNKVQAEEIGGEISASTDNRNRTTYKFNTANKSYSINWRSIPREFSQLSSAKVKAVIKHNEVIKVIYQGKTFTDIYAFAPYNFVPLNDTLIAAKFDESKLSGYIDLAITTKTPIFIRGKNEDFLMINNKPVLPGSSIRGMVRTLVEIASYGKFVNFNDLTLYHRKPWINGLDPTAGRRIGFLNFDENDGSYFICEAKYNLQPVPKINNWAPEFEYQFEEIGSNCWVKIYSGQMGRQNFKIQYEKKTPENQFPIDYKIVKSYTEDDSRNAGGEMKNLIDTVKKPYSGFKKKLEDLKIPYIGIPVWYKTEIINGEVKLKHFGHCRNYRLPYDYSIGSGEHIPSPLKEAAITDFAESIFGTTTQAGRVCFEDAITGSANWKLAETAFRPKILASPKPTTFQHYLAQNPLFKDTPQKKLKNWDNNEAKLRGYKLYWHRNTPDNNSDYSWIERGTITTSHPDPIKPVKKDIVFNSRIRFDGLSPEELGCLLFVLDLPEGCCHKLGMAKPLGLGSIQIKPELVLINRKARYSKLFDTDGNWYTGTENPQFMINELKKLFENYILSHLSADETMSVNTQTTASLWDVGRMSQLKIMLTFNEITASDNAWLERTRYMKVDPKPNEYKNRPVLPAPNEVVELYNESKAKNNA